MQLMLNGCKAGKAVFTGGLSTVCKFFFLFGVQTNPLPGLVVSRLF